MKTLSTVLTFRLSILMAVGFLSVCAVTDTLIRHRIEEELVEHLRIQCVMVDHLLPTNRDSIQPLVERTARSAMARLAVVTDSGIMLADSDTRTHGLTSDSALGREEVKMAIRNPSGYGFRFQPDAPFGENLVHVAYRSPRDRFILITREASYSSNLVYQVRLVFILSAALGLMLIVAFHHDLTKRLGDPLNALIKAVNAAKNGPYDTVAVSEDPTEIGRLTQAINELSGRVQQDIERLRTVQEIRKDFVTNASHELRTPVSSIRGYVETLLEGAINDEQVSRRFLERALSNVIRLEAIVNDMLDLSRLESRDRALSLRYFEVAGMIRNVLADFDDAAKRKGLELIYESDLPPNFEILADPYQVEKALVNLVENGIKYTETGYVKITSLADATYCSLTIEDTGPGIRAEDIPRIFERFYRVDKARSREMGGSGLGLSIVRHIMEIHGGTVNVQSEPGKGTKFVLLFPSKGELNVSK